MELDEFLSKKKSKTRKSEIEPFYDDLLAIKARNYTLETMREYLLENGVTVSVSAISKYLKRREHVEEILEPELGSETDKPKNVTRFVDQDKLTKLKNHKRGDL